MAKQTELGRSLNLKLLLSVIYCPRPGLSTVSAAARTPIRVIVVTTTGYLSHRRLAGADAPYCALRTSLGTVAGRVACGVGAASPHPNRFYRLWRSPEARSDST
jgi:hypothetical protein